MRLAIMQPYFFPYLGYFALIKHSDKFIVFDTPQFIRHGWIERNRVLKPIEGWQYIKVPLIKNSQNISIKESRIRTTENWQEKILSQLGHYKKKARYYHQTVNLIKESINISTTSIVDLNINCLRLVSNYLNIDFKYEIFSNLNLKMPKPQMPDEWALYISKELIATEYINPIGGIDFFDKNKYKTHNIDLVFLNYFGKEYNQMRVNFEANLSIIDALMFNKPEEINRMLDFYKLIR